MRKMVRPSNRAPARVPRQSTVRPSTRSDIPVGRIKTVLLLCNQHIEYGDNKAVTAKHERADSADFYRRAAELAMAELYRIINPNQEEN